MEKTLFMEEGWRADGQMLTLADGNNYVEYIVQGPDWQIFNANAVARNSTIQITLTNAEWFFRNSGSTHAVNLDQAIAIAAWMLDESVLGRHPTATPAGAGASLGDLHFNQNFNTSIVDRAIIDELAAMANVNLFTASPQLCQILLLVWLILLLGRMSVVLVGRVL
jgi:hypothetical protein